MAFPILYSYRRCPYAMRARMALKLAEIGVEIREISLRDKPAHMLQISSKATVPVLVLQDGTVIDESLAIMYWALKKHPLIDHIDASSEALVLENDGVFKQALDAYKYPERQPNLTQQQHRAHGEIFLQKLENLLHENRYLQKNNAFLQLLWIFYSLDHLRPAYKVEFFKLNKVLLDFCEVASRLMPARHCFLMGNQ